MPEKMNRRTLLGTAGAAVALGTTSATAQQSASPRKLIGISTSLRPGKTTAAAVQVCLEAAKAADPSLDIELVDLAEMSIPAQVAVGLPLKEGETDDFPVLAAKLEDPAVKGLIVGSPVYFGNMSAQCKAFLDRCIAFRKNNFSLSGKVAGALAVGGSRNGGQEWTVESIKNGLSGQDVTLVGTARPTTRIGATLWSQEGSIDNDDYGQQTAKDLGKRIVEMVKRLEG